MDFSFPQIKDEMRTWSGQVDVSNLISIEHSLKEKYNDHPNIVSKLLDIIVLLEWLRTSQKDLDLLFERSPFISAQLNRTLNLTKELFQELDSKTPADIDNLEYERRMDKILQGEPHGKMMGLIEGKTVVVHVSYKMLSDVAIERGVTPGFIYFERELSVGNSQAVPEDVFDRWTSLSPKSKMRCEREADKLMQRESRKGTSEEPALPQEKILEQPLKEEIKETPKEEVKETPKEEIKEALKEEVKEIPKEEIKETPKEEIKETLKEEIKETPKQEAGPPGDSSQIGKATLIPSVDASAQ